MAIYHLHVKNIGRRHGRSIVAAAAYRAGETLPNEAEERESHFGGRRDVVHAEIRLPIGAPAWMTDRARLWNAVEASERRKDARLGKEVEFALPRELSPAIWLDLVRGMADACTARGLVVDLAIHDDGMKRNPHAHMLLATRAVTQHGFGLKLREVDEIAFVTEMRGIWEGLANEALGKIGSAVEISARSNAARGLAPTDARHRGPDGAERRRKRAEAAAYRKERTMPRSADYHPEAYREVVTNADQPWRAYHALTKREDWPPPSREPIADMTAEERRELGLFWEDVDRASVVFEVVQTPPDSRDPDQLPSHDSPDRELFDRLEAARVARESVVKFRPGDVTRSALDEWGRLEKSLHARMRAEGHQPGPPTDWQEVREGMDAFREKLVELRTLEEENRRYRERFAQWARDNRDIDDGRAAPGPDGDVVPQRELDEAQDRMIDDMERPAPIPAPVSDREYLQQRLAARRQEQTRQVDRDRDR